MQAAHLLVWASFVAFNENIGRASYAERPLISSNALKSKFPRVWRNLYESFAPGDGVDSRIHRGSSLHFGSISMITPKDSYLKGYCTLFLRGGGTANEDPGGRSSAVQGRGGRRGRGRGRGGRAPAASARPLGSRGRGRGRGRRGGGGRGKKLEVSASEESSDGDEEAQTSAHTGQEDGDDESSGAESMSISSTHHTRVGVQDGHDEDDDENRGRENQDQGTSGSSSRTGDDHDQGANQNELHSLQSQVSAGIPGTALSGRFQGRNTRKEIRAGAAAFLPDSQPGRQGMQSGPHIATCGADQHTTAAKSSDFMGHQAAAALNSRLRSELEQPRHISDDAVHEHQQQQDQRDDGAGQDVWEDADQNTDTWVADAIMRAMAAERQNTGSGGKTWEVPAKIKSVTDAVARSTGLKWKVCIVFILMKGFLC
jgi:hypothetical protein